MRHRDGYRPPPGNHMGPMIWFLAGLVALLGALFVFLMRSWS